MVGDTERADLCCVGVKPSIPALRGPGGGLVVAPAEKASILGSQFNSKQYSEQFDTRLSCFPQYRCNSFAFRTSSLLPQLLNFHAYGGVDPLGVFFLSKEGWDILPQN